MVTMEKRMYSIVQHLLMRESMVFWLHTVAVMHHHEQYLMMQLSMSHVWVYISPQNDRIPEANSFCPALVSKKAALGPSSSSWTPRLVDSPLAVFAIEALSSGDWDVSIVLERGRSFDCAPTDWLRSGELGVNSHELLSGLSLDVDFGDVIVMFWPPGLAFMVHPAALKSAVSTRKMHQQIDAGNFSALLTSCDVVIIKSAPCRVPALPGSKQLWRNAQNWTSWSMKIWQ